MSSSRWRVLHPSRAERQQRLRALQRLALALLVHAQDQSLLRRVHVEADHIADFIDEGRIGGKLAHLGAMGLEAKGLPDPVEASWVRPQRFAIERMLQCVACFSLLPSVRMMTRSTCASLGVRGRHSAPRQPSRPTVAARTAAATCLPSASPRVPLRRWPCGHALGAPQHNPRTLRQRLTALASRRDRRQSLPLLVGQHQPGFRSSKIDHA